MYNRPVRDGALTACPHCDLLQRVPELAEGASARCPRCEKELRRRRPHALERSLALAVAAAILFLVANVMPMIGLQVAGRSAATTVVGGAVQLWRDGRQIVAGLVLGTAVVAPALQIGFVLLIAIRVRRGTAPRWVGTLMRHHPHTCTWSMIEVMLVGVLVSVIKIAEIATVVPGVSMLVLGVLVFLLAAIQANFDSREVWDRVVWEDPSGDGAPATGATGNQP